MNRFFLSRYCFSLLLVFGWSVSVFAQTTNPLPLFLPEVKGQHGKFLPVDKETKRLLTYVERQSGLRFEIKTLPWNRVKLMVENGNGIVYGMSQSPERLKTYHFSLPLKTEQVWAISYGDDNPKIDSIQDLRGRKITITKGFTYGLEFERSKNVIFDVEENYNFNPDHLKNLVNNQKNVVLWPVRNRMNAQQFQTYFHKTAIHNYNDPTLSNLKFNVSSKPLFFDTTHFASARNKYEAEMEKIDEVIRLGIKNGELAKFSRNTK